MQSAVKVRVARTATGGMGEGEWGPGVASNLQPRMHFQKSVKVSASAEHLPI